MHKNNGYHMEQLLAWGLEIYIDMTIFIEFRWSGMNKTVHLS